jgi:acetyl esterase/lipase
MKVISNVERTKKRVIKVLFFVSFCCFYSFSMAQKPFDFPKDTSFNIKSTFIKEQKKFPFITVANPSVGKNVRLIENIVYQTIGDRALHLDILYPKRITKIGRPAIILIHGGGWRSGEKSQTLPIAKQLTDAGYVAVAVEYRLSLEAKYPAGMQDLRTAIRWMRANAKVYGIDENRIAAMGFSSGGQMAALLGTSNGDLKYDLSGSKINGDIQAVIDVDGVLAFKHPESSEGTYAEAWLGGTSAQILPIWNEASALSRVDQKSAPILYINSSMPRFHAGRDDMIKKLNAFNIYSEVHEFSTTPHPFWFFNPWFKPTVSYTLGFLKRVFDK